MLIFSLLSIGVIGFLGMTFLFPLGVSAIPAIGKALGSGRRTYTGDSEHRGVGRVNILIPVHNDAAALEKTLISLEASIKEARKDSSWDFHVLIGTDGCSDNSASIARKYGAQVIESDIRRGKWRTLCDLASLSPECDWFILADAGIYWPENFLIKLLPYFSKKNIMAVAPTYKNPNGGLVENALWGLERQLKKLESLSGGPLSVHGATVSYRSGNLLTALSELQNGTWLNDDVVLPFYLRGRYGNQRIVYATEIEVREFSRPSHVAEFNRRRRMVHGNLEWITRLWLPMWKQNTAVALLASRRIFRVFWAYWISLFALGVLSALALATGGGLYVAALVALLGCLTAKKLGTLYKSAAASLMAPLYFAGIFAASPNSTATEVLPWN